MEFLSNYPEVGVGAWGGGGTDATCRRWNGTIWEGTSEYFMLRAVVLTESTPPVTINNYNGLWHASDFTITLTSTDSSGISATYYRINGGPVQNVSWNGHPRITIEGNNNILEYWSKDVVGNEELPHKMLIEIKLDKTMPSVTISSPIEGENILSSTVTITWSGSDSGSGIDKYEVKLDSGIWIDKGSVSSHTFNGINAGSHTVYVRATDKAGNSREYQRSFTYQQSMELVAAPTFNPAGGVYSSQQSVSISCGTNGATIRYTTNGAEPTSSSSLYSGPILVSSGTLTIKAKAFKTEMLDSNTASATFTISIPTSTIVTPTPTPSQTPESTPTKTPSQLPIPSSSSTISPTETVQPQLIESPLFVIGIFIAVVFASTVLIAFMMKKRITKHC